MQPFLDRLRVRLHDPEALVVRLLGVVAGQVEKPALVPALRNLDVDPCGSAALARYLLKEQVFQSFPVFKIHWQINISRNVRLTDVKLLKQGRKKFPRMERISGVTGVLARSAVSLICRVWLGRTGEDARRSIGLQFGQFFPEKLSPVEHPPTAHVE